MEDLEGMDGSAFYKDNADTPMPESTTLMIMMYQSQYDKEGNKRPMKRTDYAYKLDGVIYHGYFENHHRTKVPVDINWMFGWRSLTIKEYHRMRDELNCDKDQHFELVDDDETPIAIRMSDIKKAIKTLEKEYKIQGFIPEADCLIAASHLLQKIETSIIGTILKPSTESVVIEDEEDN